MNKDDHLLLQNVLTENSTYISCPNPPHATLKIKCAPVFLSYLQKVTYLEDYFILTDMINTEQITSFFDFPESLCRSYIDLFTIKDKRYLETKQKLHVSRNPYYRIDSLNYGQKIQSQIMERLLRDPSKKRLCR